MYNLTVGLKLKNDIPFDEWNIKYLRKLFCFLLGKEKNKFHNCMICKHNNIKEVKMPFKKTITVVPSSEVNCIIKENFIIYKDEIKLFINCNSYESINKIIQELYKLDSIEIAESEFDISEIELKYLNTINEDTKITQLGKTIINSHNENLIQDEMLELVHNM